MKNKLFTLLFLLIICSPLYSQNYQSEKESLLTLKNKLKSENVILKSNVDSLTTLFSSLSKELTDNQSELTELKKEVYIKRYGRDNGKRIAAGRIWKGMTMDMLKEVYGKPDKVTSNKYSYGTFTQLYYGDITYFFKNSVLIDWEQGKEK